MGKIFQTRVQRQQQQQQQRQRIQRQQRWQQQHICSLQKNLPQSVFVFSRFILSKPWTQKQKSAINYVYFFQKSLV